MVFNLYLNAARPHAWRRFGATDIAGVPLQARVRILPRGPPYENASLSLRLLLRARSGARGAMKLEFEKEVYFIAVPRANQSRKVKSRGDERVELRDKWSRCKLFSPIYCTTCILYCSI